MAQLDPETGAGGNPEPVVRYGVGVVTDSSAVQMLWFTLALLGSAAGVGAFAAHAKQALLDDAQAATEGYF